MEIEKDELMRADLRATFPEFFKRAFPWEVLILDAAAFMRVALTSGVNADQDNPLQRNQDGLDARSIAAEMKFMHLREMLRELPAFENSSPATRERIEAEILTIPVKV